MHFSRKKFAALNEQKKIRFGNANFTLKHFISTRELEGGRAENFEASHEITRAPFRELSLFLVFLFFTFNFLCLVDAVIN